MEGQAKEGYSLEVQRDNLIAFVKNLEDGWAAFKNIKIAHNPKSSQSSPNEVGTLRTCFLPKGK